MRLSPPKVLNLPQLVAELQSAGIAVPALGATYSDMTQPNLCDSVYTYGSRGDVIDVPAAAASVIAAHVPQPTELDVSATDLNTNYQTALTRLDAIINATNPTQAQMQQAIQDEARMLRRLLRFVFNAVPPKRP